MATSATQFTTLLTTTAEPLFVDEADVARWKYAGGGAGFAVVLLRMTQFVLGFVIGGLLSLWFVCFVGLNQRAHSLAHASYASLAVADIFACISMYHFDLLEYITNNIECRLRYLLYGVAIMATPAFLTLTSMSRLVELQGRPNFGCWAVWARGRGSSFVPQLSFMWAFALTISTPAVLFYSVTTITVDANSTLSFCSLVDDHGVLGVLRRAHTIVTAGVWIGLTSFLIILNHRINKLILEKVSRNLENNVQIPEQLEGSSLETDAAQSQNENNNEPQVPTEQNGSKAVPTSSPTTAVEPPKANSPNAPSPAPPSTGPSNGTNRRPANGGVSAEVERSFTRRALGDLRKAHRAHVIVSAICASAWFLVVVEEPFVQALVMHFTNSHFVSYLVLYAVRTGPLIALYAKLFVLLGMEPALRRTRPICLRRLGRMARVFDSRNDNCLSRLSGWIARRGRRGVMGPPGEHVHAGGSQFAYTYHVGRPDPLEDEEGFGLGNAAGGDLASPSPEPTSPTSPQPPSHTDNQDANRWDGPGGNTGLGISATPTTQASLALMLSENA